MLTYHFIFIKITPPSPLIPSPRLSQFEGTVGPVGGAWREGVEGGEGLGLGEDMQIVILGSVWRVDGLICKECE